jgi:hypothetical protein
MSIYWGYATATDAGDPAWQVVRIAQPSFGLSILQKRSNQRGIHAEGDFHEKQITSNDAGGSD